MILTKYILKKIFKNQLIILTILLLFCICQKLIKILGSDNIIPIHLILLYFIINIPELSKLIIPFSLFLSVIITYYKLHIHNEILAMYSCAIKKSFFIQNILLYSFIIAYIAFINISWLSPYCEQYRNYILSKINKNTYFNQLIEKKFYFFPDKKIVLFINHINNTKLENIFMIQTQHNTTNDTFSIITAEQGNIQYNYNYLLSITFNIGNYYEIPYIYTTTHSNIYLTNFSKYHTLIDYRSNLLYKAHHTINNMSISQLWKLATKEAKIEYSWRFTLLISIFVLPLIALLLTINIIQNYLLNFLLAIILYAFFFLSQILLRSYAILNYTNAIIWIWLINFIYFIIALLISLSHNFKLKIFFKKFPMLFFKKN